MDSLVIVIEPGDLDWLKEQVEFDGSWQADRVRKCLENPWTVDEFIGAEMPFVPPPEAP